MKTVIVAFMLLFNYLDTLPKLYILISLSLVLISVAFRNVI